MAAFYLVVPVAVAPTQSMQPSVFAVDCVAPLRDIPPSPIAVAVRRIRPCGFVENVPLFYLSARVARDRESPKVSTAPSSW